MIGGDGASGRDSSVCGGMALVIEALGQRLEKPHWLFGKIYPRDLPCANFQIIPLLVRLWASQPKRMRSAGRVRIYSGFSAGKSDSVKFRLQSGDIKFFCECYKEV